MAYLPTTASGNLVVDGTQRAADSQPKYQRRLTPLNASTETRVAVTSRTASKGGRARTAQRDANAMRYDDCPIGGKLKATIRRG
jgi:hypothetical protein